MKLIRWILAVLLVLTFALPCLASASTLTDLLKSFTTVLEDEDETIYQLGEVATIDDIDVTLLNIYESNGSTYNKPSAGNIFVLCEFLVENNSKKELDISSMLCFSAYCDDYSCDTSFSAELEAENMQTLDGSIAKGKKMKGVVGFELPNDWKVLEIHFTPDFWSSGKLMFAVNHP